MKTFNVCIIANNVAGAWTTWPETMEALKAFYAPVCNLNFTLVRSALSPLFALNEPTSGNGTVYQVDEAWYEKNVSPIGSMADIIMFYVPSSDHPGKVVLMGIESGDALGPWETTVFCDETDHVYDNGIDQGTTAVVLGCHELSHAFYAMLERPDRTHECFYGGNPAGVLTDFNFEIISLYQKLIGLLTQLLGARKQQIATDQAPNTSQTSYMQHAHLDAFCTAIRDNEGNPGDLNYKNNNPGNFRCSPVGYLPKYGNVLCVDTASGKFAKFPTYPLGWEYLQASVIHRAELHPDWTFYDFFTNYAPSSDKNDPNAYAEFVAKRCGVSPSMTLRDYFAA